MPSEPTTLLKYLHIFSEFILDCQECFLQQLHVQAAKGGNTEQMGVLSSMLDVGYGCTADPLQAKVWAHKAAAQIRNP